MSTPLLIITIPPPTKHELAGVPAAAIVMESNMAAIYFTPSQLLYLKLQLSLSQQTEKQ